VWVRPPPRAPIWRRDRKQVLQLSRSAPKFDLEISASKCCLEKQKEANREMEAKLVPADF
jgi:hypothetical protein